DEAAAAYEKALAVYERSQDLRTWAQVAYSAADVYRSQGHCDRANRLYQRVIELADAGRAEQRVGAVARAGLGVCQLSDGKPADAIATLDVAVHDLDALGETLFAAQYRLWIAEAEWKRGRRAEARRFAKAVEDSLPDDGDGVNHLLRQQ